MNLRKLEFMGRLLKLTGCYDDLMILFKEENLATEFEIKTISSDADKPRQIVTLLEKLKSEERLMLLDYEWTVLPKEFLKLTIVTERVSKEYATNS